MCMLHWVIKQQKHIICHNNKDCHPMMTNTILFQYLFHNMVYDPARLFSTYFARSSIDRHTHTDIARTSAFPRPAFIKFFLCHINGAPKEKARLTAQLLMLLLYIVPVCHSMPSLTTHKKSATTLYCVVALKKINTLIW